MSSTTPKQQDAQEYVNRLRSAALRHRAVNHPYLGALGSGGLPCHQQAVADFSEQYANYSGLFTTFLTTLEPQLNNPEHRSRIRDNIAEASGQYDSQSIAMLRDYGVPQEDFDGVAHHDLFMRFTRAVGGTTSQPSFAVRRWNQSMLQLMERPGGHEGVGALGLGTEFIVPRLYSHIERALDYLPTISSYDRTFFTIHGPVDEVHQNEFKAIAVDLCVTAAGRRRVARGMFETLEHRACLWDWLYERAFNRTQEAFA